MSDEWLERLARPADVERLTALSQEMRTRLMRAVYGSDAVLVRINDEGQPEAHLISPDEFHLDPPNAATPQPSACDGRDNPLDEVDAMRDED